MISITAGGDALFVRPFPENYPDKALISSLITQGDVRAVNLETTITDGCCHGSAYSGGTWVTACPEILDELSELGFNYFGIANNHTMDYSYEGLSQTITAMQQRGLAFSGAGDDLEAASAPAYIDTPDGRAAVISVCSTFNMAAAAGAATPFLPGRPGLNPLRFTTVYEVSRQELECLKSIGSRVKVNGLKELHREQGFETALPEGIYEFGGNLFRCAPEGGASRRTSSCNKNDLSRITDSIRKALGSCSYAVVMVHSHEVLGDCDEEADMFLEEFAHACIDAGACAVIGGGTHQLKGLEIYKNAPIFYSLGNFIFQNSLVEKLPADFMEKYGLPLTSTAAEAIIARSRTAKRSLADSTPCYRSVIPQISLDKKGCRELTLRPIELGQQLGGDLKNIPHLADGAVCAEVCEYLQRVSARYGTRFELEDERIRVIL